ncbi:hypothetical protein CO134_00990 [Candidatus Kuenenbacteria bacterium CG_4_9_14_3_um_filter_39_14]|uniref:TNase-like domain-containing protein n=7 Tax=Candidatus Kueneniibacteriota TaxID=1752740 RepID=A0A2M7IL69_9BACT|nr:hypothetical protein [Candidatus Kuenenbacteria bacterium]OIP55972.1 MAG: hypothetical protein AUK13_01885 [Candidatus Kuenenbacteria bacterium CG2_30_39_24]PIP29050.1 MAG: hypothetical protein COX28_01335 [Candidatus Kuenenbacteria bacterium CG23_combo_of_CG06-09_8_20_14_all_39_39]PIP75385.1 MAG: hypothetical protein COW86_04085 [Candidatus Kuenenbacteria bacterium CG22_combo_CG10-13_8_21_14_all_39_9]PIR80687.1 MAG: hypothetical protein COU24_02680 [Candidatus Kuenenbacteria bacterium CG10_
MKLPKIKQKYFLFPVIVLGIILAWLGFYDTGDKQSTGDGSRAKVIQVIDGDTFRINGDEKIRLLGIDAPEEGDCYYGQAQAALKELVEDKVVRLDKDIEEQDKYDRLLRYVILEKEAEDNLLVNDYLVRQGFAFDTSSSPNNRYRDLLSSAEEEAKREGRGLWLACDYAKTADLREQNNLPADPNCIIKGNISEKGFGKTYLIPGCDNYETVKIDKRKGEGYFCTESEAIKAGFKKATNCP